MDMDMYHMYGGVDSVRSIALSRCYIIAWASACCSFYNTGQCEGLEEWYERHGIGTTLFLLKTSPKAPGDFDLSHGTIRKFVYRYFP